jgi:hypothetical protein
MNWKAEIYIDGELVREEAAETQGMMYAKMRLMAQDMNMSEEEEDRFNLCEIFNEAIS